MISPSKHYSNLQSALVSARTIVHGVNPIQCTTQLQHLKLQSYILLAHSAIEQYIEDLVLDASKIAVDLLQNENKFTTANIALISSEVMAQVSREKARKKISKDMTRNILEFARLACSEFHNIVRQNNGITSESQEKLFLPLGVNPIECDIASSQAMNSFGKIRGDIAHKFSIRREHTLSAIDVEIQTIKDGLSEFDSSICTVISSVS